MAAVCRELTVNEELELKDAWHDSLSRVCDNVSSHDKMDEWWTRLKTMYSEEGRHYHTLSHVHHMITLEQTVGDKLRQPDLVVLAIFFHDIIYDPKASDNEEQSAELFRLFSKEIGMKETDADKVISMIMLTKSHMPSEDDDSNYLLDIDMAVLGLPQNDYKLYADGIRKEYNHYSKHDYKQGRTAVLQKMLAMKNIFASEEFRENVEDQARNNIAHEITRLAADDF